MIRASVGHSFKDASWHPATNLIRCFALIPTAFLLPAFKQIKAPLGLVAVLLEQVNAVMTIFFILHA